MNYELTKLYQGRKIAVFSLHNDNFIAEYITNYN